MNTGKTKFTSRQRRRSKIRSRISGTADCPRLSVFKSNKHIMAQLIDDVSGKTLGAAHSRDVKKGTLLEKSHIVGESIATLAKAKKINKIVFDRGGFMYTGCVKAVAEGARSGGLAF